jgi:deazaflavin-dependent oxidoreductase (nitroreductase family)
MRVDPLTQAWTRWFSSIDVALYRLFGGLSPLDWNKLILTTRGRKTGRDISTPLMFQEQGGKLYVVASFGGSDAPPAWYLNLVSDPEVRVERGWSRVACRARTLSPAEKQAVWPKLVGMFPAYADYQRRTTRDIPVVELTRV